MNELISVIVPIYNVEKYLERCIDSILNQTYNSLEIILVDDGSLDNSGFLCDEYLKKDSRIRVIKKENGGLSDARNAGLNIAKGEYIAFIDSDDWIHHTYFERLLTLLTQTSSDISVCDFVKVWSEGDVPSVTYDNYIYEYSNIEALEQLTDKFFIQMAISCCKLYKKELFKDVRFPYGKVHEDEFVTYQLLFLSKKVVLTTEQLYYYLQRPDSIMALRLNNIKYILHNLEAYKERAAFFDLKKLYNLRDKTFEKLIILYKEILDNKEELIKLGNYDELFNEYETLKKDLIQLKLKHINIALDTYSMQDLKQVYISALPYDKLFSKIIRNKLANRGLLDEQSEWLYNERIPDKNKKYIIFGAGHYGKKLLEYLKRENVDYFADNIKTGIDESSKLKILSLEEVKQIWKEYNIVICASEKNSIQIIDQFINNGIKKYYLYNDIIE